MSENAETKVATHDDGRFLRTALVIDPGPGGGGSVDLLSKDGRFLARLNLFTSESGDWLALDLIDFEERYDIRRALVFNNGKREGLTAMGNLVAADFRMEKDGGKTDV